jgi:hypothetical protein
MNILKEWLKLIDLFLFFDEDTGTLYGVSLEVQEQRVYLIGIYIYVPRPFLFMNILRRILITSYLIYLFIIYITIPNSNCNFLLHGLVEFLV